jgi:hypothetical protein
MKWQWRYACLVLYMINHYTLHQFDIFHTLLYMINYGNKSPYFVIHQHKYDVADKLYNLLLSSLLGIANRKLTDITAFSALGRV